VIDNYLGPSVDTEGVEYVWAGIHHFFEYDFYVYSYCFSYCVVNTLYETYKSGKIQDFAAKYMEMLSESGVENYHQALSRFGIDASSPTFWEDGMSLFAQKMTELEALAKEIQA
jgi:oligoendopeptidase F